MNGLISSSEGHKLNPFHPGMGLLADAQGGKMFEVTTDNPFVYGFAAGKDGRILLYLLNKTKQTRALEISLTKGQFSDVAGRLMRDTSDHWGEIADLPVEVGRTFEATLPPLTFCRISFK